MKSSRITRQDVITSSGKYPERQNSPELTDEVIKNIDVLVEKVNALLEHIGWKEKVVISSGFRPTSVNAQVKNAAKKSPHTMGMAVDIEQPKNDNRLAKVIMEFQERDGILTRLGLWMEDPQFTVGSHTAWVHLDFLKRRDRPSRIFRP